jgi:DnaJ-class molecular chaperone
MKPAIIWALFVIAVVTQYVESFSVLHKILNINENATVEELKIAYEKLLQQW